MNNTIGALNKVSVIYNEDVKESLQIADYIKNLFIEKNINTVVNPSSNFDKEASFAIAIGGDGSFLRMVKACNFSDNIHYIGINTGTLGFAQEIYPDKIDLFISNLNKNRYKKESISIQETKITTKEETLHLYSLNEIVIRHSQLNTLHLKVLINDFLLENYCGDGLLISTSFGSTAYNLSFKGSIVYNDLHTLQITPIAPLNNKSYNSLSNSIIIPEKRTIKIIPIKDNNLIVSIDGENNHLTDVLEITNYVKRKKIKLIRTKEYDYTKKINEKFL